MLFLVSKRCQYLILWAHALIDIEYLFSSYKMQYVLANLDATMAYVQNKLNGVSKCGLLLNDMINDLYLLCI